MESLTQTGQIRAQQWLKKVALVRALRETFVEELGGMIDADEAWTNIPRNNVHDVIEQDEPKETEQVIDIDEL